MSTKPLDMNDGSHSRFNEEHYRTCQPCLEDHDDFMQEQADEARMDAMEYSHGSVEDGE